VPSDTFRLVEAECKAGAPNWAVRRRARIAVATKILTWHHGIIVFRDAFGETLYRLPLGWHRATPEVLRRLLRHHTGRIYPWEAGFDHTPPPPAAGDVVGPPDFVGIGVQKAGTTWWWRLIVRHPKTTARPSLPKERHFFAAYAMRAFTAADIEMYEGWFPRRVGTLCGEWTPDYMYHPWVAPLIAKVAPDTRLLVIVRNPIERFRSHLAQVEITRGSHLGTTLARIAGGGFYAAQLRPWLDYFDRSQILLLQYELCVRDTASELARTYRFLGLNDAYQPPDIGHRTNVTHKEKIVLDADSRHRMAEMYAPDVAELATLMPNLDLSLWPDFVVAGDRARVGQACRRSAQTAHQDAPRSA